MLKKGKKEKENEEKRPFSDLVPTLRDVKLLEMDKDQVAPGAALGPWVLGCLGCWLTEPQWVGLVVESTRTCSIPPRRGALAQVFTDPSPGMEGGRGRVSVCLPRTPISLLTSMVSESLMMFPNICCEVSILVLKTPCHQNGFYGWGPGWGAPLGPNQMASEQKATCDREQWAGRAGGFEQRREAQVADREQGVGVAGEVAQRSVLFEPI